MLDLNAPAELYRLEDEPRENFSTDRLDLRTMILSSNLADCVEKAMSKPEAERIHYAIKVEHNPLSIPDRSYSDVLLLDYPSIQAQYDRPDFPRKRS
jgi:hypothetical protein